MPRTPEQVAADDGLAAAINDCRTAYSEDGQLGMITEYLVIYASRSWDDDGDGLTSIGRAVSWPAEPLHHQLGMLEYVAAEYRQRIVETD